jgi:hypothetical protein
VSDTFDAAIEESILVAYSRLLVVREALASLRWAAARAETEQLGEQGAQLLLLSTDLAHALAQRTGQR